MFPFHLFSVYVIFSSGGPPAHVLCSIPPSSPLHRLPSWMPWTPRWTPLLLASLESRSAACWLSCCAQTVCVCLERLACPEIFHHCLLTSSAAPRGVLLSRSPLFAWPLGSPLRYFPVSKSFFSSPRSSLTPVLTSVRYSGKAFPALSPTPTQRPCLLEVNPCPPAFPGTWCRAVACPWVFGGLAPGFFLPSLACCEHPQVDGTVVTVLRSTYMFIFCVCLSPAFLSLCPESVSSFIRGG